MRAGRATPGVEPTPSEETARYTPASERTGQRRSRFAPFAQLTRGVIWGGSGGRDFLEEVPISRIPAMRAAIVKSCSRSSSSFRRHHLAIGGGNGRHESEVGGQLGDAEIGIAAVYQPVLPLVSRP